MYIHARTGLKADFIAFGGAFLGRIVVLLGLFLSSAMAQAMCAQNLVNFPDEHALISEARYIDLKKVAQIPKAELPKRSEAYIELQLRLEERKESLLAHRGLIDKEYQKTKSYELYSAAVEGVGEELRQVSADLELVQEYIKLLDRVGLKSFKLQSEQGLPTRLVAEHRSTTHVMLDIARHLLPFKKDHERLVLRIFPIARQDLMLAHGTDEYGQPFINRAHTSIEDFGLFEGERILQTQGLKPHDGIRGMPLEHAINSYPIYTAGGVPTNEYKPFEQVENFIRGEAGIAIYDLDNMLETDSDMYIFGDVKNRKKSLLAVFLPLRRP